MPHRNRPTRKRVRRRARVLVAAALLLLCAPAFASVPTVPGPAAPDAAAPAVPQLPPDPLERRTPRGMVFGLLESLAQEDYTRSARYLDLRGGTTARQGGPALARELQTVLDRGGSIQPPRLLSSDPEGYTGDGLDPDRDRFATVRTPHGEVPLFAERVDDPELGRIWLVSAQTVAQIPALADAVRPALLERLLPESLMNGWHVAGAPLVHWAALLMLAAAAYVLARLLTALATVVLRGMAERRGRTHLRRLLDAGAVPVRLFLAAWLFVSAAALLGVSIVARQYTFFAAAAVGWLALGWLAWRAVDVLGEAVLARNSVTGRMDAFSAVHFLGRGAKIALASIAVIAIFDTLGFDVTAGLAALGLGGLALALGAQKSVENFVGSLTLVADRPVRIGDFCRFGDKLGTVEDIGMRSTRIRTLERTLVTVPNGEFASLQIENYSRRDRFWFHPTLALRYETTPDQIRYLLVELRALLYAHPRVDPNPARVRFVGLGADSLNIEIFAYVHAENYDDFLEVQEDLTLRIMDVVAQSGAGFAFPSHTVYLARDGGLAADKRAAAEARVREWRERNALELPRFRPERIAGLRNSLVYPPEGSAMHVPAGAGGSEQKSAPASRLQPERAL